MNKDYGIFRDLVEGNLTVMVNDFGGYTHADVEFPFQAKIEDFGDIECTVRNLDNGKSYPIYNVSIEEYNRGKYSEYVWNALMMYFKINFLINHKEFHEPIDLIEEVEYLMQDIGISKIYE